MSFFYFFTIACFLLLCGLLCLLVLVQEGKGGLGASFGGDSGESMFGTSTPEVLKKLTGYFAVVFITLCVVLSFWTGLLDRHAGVGDAPQVTQTR